MLTWNENAKYIKGKAVKLRYSHKHEKKNWRANITSVEKFLMAKNRLLSTWSKIIA